MKYFNLENLGIFLLFLIILGFLFSPLLVGNKIIFEAGTLTFHYPAYTFFSKAFQNPNMSFLWSSSHLSGFPIYLVQIGFFHPFNILYKFFNSLTVYHWLLFLNFFLGLVFTYLLARNLKLSKISSSMVAFAYVLCQSWLGIGQLSGHANLIPFFPLLFLLLLKISQRKKIFTIVGAFVFAIGWLACPTEELLYIGVAAFLFALFFDIKEYSHQVSFFRNFPTTKAFLILLIISLVLASFWLLPTAQFIKFSSRGTGDQLARYGGIDIGAFVRFFYPHFDFRYLTGHYTVFIGVLTFFLAIASFLIPKKNKILKFFICLSVLIFLLSFKYSPFIWLLSNLPILKLFRFPVKWWLINNLALAILAGFALDNLEKIRERLRFKNYIKILKVFVIGFLTLILVANFVIFFLRSQVINLANQLFDKYLYFKTTQAPIEYYHQIMGDLFDQTARVVSLANPKLLFALIFILISVGLLIFYQKGRFRILTENFKIIALIIIILNLVFLWEMDDRTRIHAPKKTLSEPPPIVRFLQNQELEKEPFRIYRFIPPLRPVEYIELGLNDLRDNPKLLKKFYFETLRPNTNIMYNLDSIEGHDHFITRRHSRILHLFGSLDAFLSALKYESWDKMSQDPSITTQDKLRIFQSEKNRSLLSMMNVRYVISIFEYSLPWIKALETRVVEEKTGDSVPVYVYENPGVLPKVYFANSVKFVEPDEEMAFESLMEIEDFKKDTLIECLKCQNYELGIMNYEDKIIVEEIKDGYLKLRIKTTSPRWLIRSESNLPTWEVKINGKLTEIYTANYLYQAILVPEGENEIEFKYPGIFKQFSYSLKALISK